MRIIAGEKRGRTFDAPTGRDTRPTLDRVREAIFGMIQFDIANRSVLDLFAGSGAMGLEALSRYASNAVFCDGAKDAVGIVKGNIVKLGFSDRAQVMCCDFRQAIASCAASGRRFDIVFLDPPYESGLIVPAITALNEYGVLNEGFQIAAEYSLELPPQIPEGFAERKQKKYGCVGVSVIVKDVRS